MKEESQQVLKKYLQVNDLLSEIERMIEKTEFTAEEIRVLKSIADDIENKTISLFHLKEEENGIW